MTDVQPGLRANARQFGLLVLLHGFVGAMVGLERSVLPLVGERDFRLDSQVTILSFVVAFGIAKAVSNLAAGGLADRVGRKRLLVAGWLLALPVPLLIAVAPNWGFVVAANVFLGASQGVAWSMTGASLTEVGVVAAAYPAVWGLGQLLTGWLSDHTGRKPLIVAGMLVQAGALALLVAGGGDFAPALLAAILLGLGTALVYPTLIAAVSDAVQPVQRAPAVGVYRFWRDSGFVAGALISGIVADALGAGEAIAVVAALTGASGLWVAATRWSDDPRLSAAPMADIGNHV